MICYVIKGIVSLCEISTAEKSVRKYQKDGRGRQKGESKGRNKRKRRGGEKPCGIRSGDVKRVLNKCRCEIGLSAGNTRTITTEIKQIVTFNKDIFYKENYNAEYFG